MVKKRPMSLNTVIEIAITMLLIFITTDTLLWGTNRNQLWVKAAQLLLVVCTGFLFFQMIKEKRIQIRSVKFALLILMSTSVLLTAIVNNDLRFGYFYKITLFAFGFAVTEYLTIEKFASRFNRCMFFLAITSLVGFCLEHMWPAIFNIFPKILNSVGYPFDCALLYNRDILSREIRNFGIFREPGVYQMFLSLALLFEFVYAPKVNKWRVLVYGITIITTYSTTGYAALFLVVAFAVLRNNKLSKTKKLQLTGILAGCMAVFCLIFWRQVGSIIREVFGKFSFNNESFLARFGSFRVNFTMWFRSPVFGLGLTNMDTLFKPISQQIYGVAITDNTNMLLVQFACHGFLFGAIWIYAYVRASSRLGKNILETLVIIGYIFIQGMSQNFAFSPLINVLMWYCLFAKHDPVDNTPKKEEQEKETKKIVTVNLGNYGSTGGIIKDISAMAEENGYATYQCYPRRPEDGEQGANDIPMSSYLFLRINNRLDYHTGLNGCFAVFSTANLLYKLSQIDIDILHLHNLHTSYINIPMLFAYIKRRKLRTVWTLHDCWSMTARCPHFAMAKCDQWKEGCKNCPRLRHYSALPLENSQFMWNLKKKCFTGVEDLTIVTPSRWLQSVVEESYLKEYPTKLIYNGINLTEFKPTPSNFREKYGLQDKYIVAGVAFDWGESKGLDVFVEMAKRLDDRFQIVLVGTNSKVDALLPDNIISIHRTRNRKELAEALTAADLFANPTREEVLGMVNIEALACGTPVLTFRSGGSPECVDETCGSVVDCDDVDAFEKEIIRICTEKSYPSEACMARAKLFDKNAKYQEYIQLYERNA